jgi:tetratricopeptide (TPR) repeat protein
LVEHVEELLLSREYRKVLAYAERLLQGRDRTPTEEMQLHHAVMVATFSLNQFEQAAWEGEIARFMAEELREWAYYGNAVIYLGCAYAELNQGEKAIQVFQEYLVKRYVYPESALHHLKVLHNLGIVQIRHRHHHEAIESLEGALTAATDLEEERLAYGVRLSLIEAYLFAGRIGDVPRVFAQCARYLRRHPSIPDHRDCWLGHTYLRAVYLSHRGRHVHAGTLALRGLQQSKGSPRHSYLFHLLLARIFREMGAMEAVRSQLLSARAYAMQSKSGYLQDQAYALFQNLDTSPTSTLPCP